MATVVSELDYLGRRHVYTEEEITTPVTTVCHKAVEGRKRVRVEPENQIINKQSAFLAMPPQCRSVSIFEGSVDLQMA